MVVTPFVSGGNLTLVCPLIEVVTKKNVSDFAVNVSTSKPPLAICSETPGYSLEVPPWNSQLLDLRSNVHYPSSWGEMVNQNFIFFSWPYSPMRAWAATLLRFLDHTQWHTTVGRTPVDEGSARRRDLSLTTHATFKRNRYPCPWRDSNPQSQQACGRRPPP